MKINWVSTFLFHAMIAIFYLSLTCFEFVVTANPNPIGVGIQQAFLIAIQFLAAVAYWIVSMLKGKNHKIYAVKFISSFLAICACTIIYFLFEESIWSWLWKLRE